MQKLTNAHIAGLAALAVGIVGIILSPYAPWLQTWPAAWALPVAEWIGDWLGAFLNAIKPAMRALSWLLGYPMAWANNALTATPWPMLIGLTTALGWYLGGLRMALLGGLGLLFVLATGYWTEGMNTLALVFVSVPLALLMGLTIGIIAAEVPRAKPPILATLDVMQTIPTFAYLTPLLLLFGFGPVVGLIASAIYAAPPMARNTLLALERIEPEVREAAIMAGSTRSQQLFLVELPAGARQIFVGVNQCLMAALSMVIIAAVIGGFEDIGWEVLLTMRKAQFGQAFLAGLVIVVFAIIIDRMSARLSEPRETYDRRVLVGLLAVAVFATIATLGVLPDPATLSIFDGTADAVDSAVGDFTATYGTSLDGIKNGAMFYVLLPLRIGLDDAVLPFTWGIQWTPTFSTVLFAAAALAAIALAATGRIGAGILLAIVALTLETGITNLPWPFVLAGAAALGYIAGGPRLAVFSAGLLALILLAGLWERAMLSLYLSGAAVLACAVVGGGLGLLAALSPLAWSLLRPIADMLQTIPLFVFLIPVLMFFQIGEFSAFLAICAYAIVPMIRYTREGIVTTPADLVEAAEASGATPAQILWDVRIPYAAPTILLGLNQTILYAFAMLVIAALIGTTGLGQSIYLALGSADVGLGITAGGAMAILALVADRLVQGFAEGSRKALGL